jgi:hypothetical protein
MNVIFHQSQQQIWDYGKIHNHFMLPQSQINSMTSFAKTVVAKEDD